MKTNLSQIPTHKLVAELFKRKEIIAVQIWSIDDIKSQSFENLGYDDEQTEAIAKVFEKGGKEADILRKELEDCSAGWDAVDSAIEHAADSLGFTPSGY